MRVNVEESFTAVVCYAVAPEISLLLLRWRMGAR
jgi:hypothetical protein